MSKSSSRLVRGMVGLLVVVAAVFAVPAQAGPALYAVGADVNGVGRVFTAIDPAKPGTPLGDGSEAFNGGLAYRALDDRVYAVANDSLGQSRLVAFDVDAPNTVLSSAAIGSGFYGGLAFGSAGVLYGIASDALARSTLFSIDPATGATTNLGLLGFGYFGGLTFDASDGSLVAIAGDLFGVQRSVQRISFVGGMATATTLFDLGDGSVAFHGGIAYDAVADDFLVIGSDSTGASALYAFDDGGAATLALRPLALVPGFMNAGLVFAPEATGGGGGPGGTVPEPPTLALLVGAVVAWRVRPRRGL